MLPLFRRSERQERGADAFHGAEGPLWVSDPRLSRLVCDAWVEAAVAAGYPRNPDLDGARQEDVGYVHLTARNGLRCRAAVAYLRPARRRANLRIVTGAQVLGLTFEGRRVTGLRLRGPDRADHLVTAGAEVILAAGAIGSPQILMLSGVGPAAHRQALGLPVVLNRPEVGRNLQDRLQARMVFRCREPTLNTEVRSLAGRLRAAASHPAQAFGIADLPSISPCAPGAPQAAGPHPRLCRDALGPGRAGGAPGVRRRAPPNGLRGAWKNLLCKPVLWQAIVASA